MGGLDRLLAKSLNNTIRNNLGEKTTQKVEERLFQKYGLSLTQSIEEFHKIDAVLREFFGAGADGLESKFMQSLCSAKSKNKTNNWFSITDNHTSQTIMESFGDDDKSAILNVVIEDAKIISDILVDCKIPQTSGYRKINQLIKDGLLVDDGYTITSDGRRVTKYRSLFDNIRINIVKNKITVDVQLSRPDFNDSSVLQVIYG
ncbi:MAG: transcriptional regulator [Crenarchaeota archaeon]|nr:MAG: transcriptional regulator [Thermoproteota archaeon]RDJ33804.1 MAG: transcriptional regulator [Thermoproteota archaeon]RDJ37087.1 MAG: transcriptional regulator [Thermoproteota archaeon]RDJ37378.1 MAG: transcriptional regulator [Thermoproteota archaeon]